MLFASIPSPSSDVLRLGPLTIHWYGIFIALATLAGATFAQRRFARLGGDRQISERATIAGIVMGVIGARVWHVITQFSFYRSHPSQIFDIWEGGLAIFGALIGGAIGLVFVFRHSRTDFVRFVEAAVPALPFAQALGRLGNYFNQELFGKPTTLPWGLRIDLRNRPAQYVDRGTFHPVFLYEAVLNICLGILLLTLEKRKIIPLKALLPIYITGYGIIRLLMELLRIDRRYGALNLTVNGYICLGMILVGALWCLFLFLTRTKSSGAEELNDSLA